MHSAGVKTRAGLPVIAACFRERPERTWLSALETRDADVFLTFIDSRVALIRRVQSIQPRVVLLPLRDAGGVSSAPLIVRLRQDAPNVRVIVLLAPETSRAGLAEAIRAGGEVAVLGDVDLRSALFRTQPPEGLSEREREAAGALLNDLYPADLRKALVFCIMHAHRRLSVGEVAMVRGLSARAFARRARVAHWPPPSELIGWGRLLSASLTEWCEASSLRSLARASGFANARALKRTAAQLLERPVEWPCDLAPLLVSSRLHRRVQRLARTAAGVPMRAE